MALASNVAKYFLWLVDPEVGEMMSNLKLQKLLYYSQGFHLAMYGSVLFDEDILAWEHGPVVESIYRAYKIYGAQGIPIPDDLDDLCLNETETNLLKEVYDVYGQFSAWKLRNMTHSEQPWIETPRNQPIDRALMQSFFKNYLS